MCVFILEMAKTGLAWFLEDFSLVWRNLASTHVSFLTCRWYQAKPFWDLVRLSWSCWDVGGSRERPEWELSFPLKASWWWEWCLLGFGHKLTMWSCPVFFFFFFLILFRAAPAYGSSPARGQPSLAKGQLRATVSSLHHSHSNTRAELHLWPMPQLASAWKP